MSTFLNSENVVRKQEPPRCLRRLLCSYKIRRTTAASCVACTERILSGGVGCVGVGWGGEEEKVSAMWSVWPRAGKMKPWETCLPSFPWQKKPTAWRMSDRLNVHQDCPSVWLCALHRGGSDNNNLKACLDIVSEPLSLPPLGSTQSLTRWPS